jgi:DinB superfamily
MTKAELQRELLKNHTSFVDCLRQLPESTAYYAANGKWSPAQQLEHLIKSVRPVSLAFSLPKLLLPLLFGRANRPSRTQVDLIARYKAKLAAGGKSSRPFIPGKPRGLKRICTQMEKIIQGLAQKIDRFSEAELDMYILPHPLLGKLTLREMLYFTAYHVQHHHAQVDQKVLQP